MGEITTVGLDLAKHVFQVHGANSSKRACYIGVLEALLSRTESRHQAVRHATEADIKRINETLKTFGLAVCVQLGYRFSDQQRRTYDLEGDIPKDAVGNEVLPYARTDSGMSSDRRHPIRAGNRCTTSEIRASNQN